MNFTIIFLKIEKLQKFLILFSRFSHSVTVDQKYEFLKKVYPTLS